MNQSKTGFKGQKKGACDLGALAGCAKGEGGASSGRSRLSRALSFILMLALLMTTLCACGEEVQPTTQTTTRTTSEADLGEYGLVGAINEEVSFGSSQFKLHGTLSVPDKKGEKFPGVVLVGGSGPMDRDETIGPNKMFKDIAQALIKSGIAVLRYDKRTLTHVDLYAEFPEFYKEMTIYHEIVDDAVFAVEYLLGDLRIDPEQVYVIGHSLGGNVLPIIAERLGPAKVAGIIMMAANTTPVWELLVTQTEYIAGLDGKIDEREQMAIDMYKEAAEYIGSNDFDKDSDYRKCLHVYPPYWLSIKDYAPLTTISRIDGSIRIFVLQGSRDYQVSVSDYQDWKRALGRRGEFKLYEDLNHLFMEGKGKSNPEEYLKKGTVSTEVTDDIVRFIKNEPIDEEPEEGEGE